MLDGLLQLLKDWLSWALCWLVDSFLALCFAVVQVVFALLPSVPLPAFLQNDTFLGVIQNTQFIAWFLPLGLIFWVLAFWVSLEVALVAGVPLYRFVMDLF